MNNLSALLQQVKLASDESDRLLKSVGKTTAQVGGGAMLSRALVSTLIQALTENRTIGPLSHQVKKHLNVNTLKNLLRNFTSKSNLKLGLGAGAFMGSWGLMNGGLRMLGGADPLEDKLMAKSLYGQPDAAKLHDRRKMLAFVEPAVIGGSIANKFGGAALLLKHLAGAPVSGATKAKYILGSELIGMLGGAGKHVMDSRHRVGMDPMLDIPAYDKVASIYDHDDEHEQTRFGFSIGRHALLGSALGSLAARVIKGTKGKALMIPAALGALGAGASKYLWGNLRNAFGLDQSNDVLNDRALDSSDSETLHTRRQLLSFLKPAITGDVIGDYLGNTSAGNAVKSSISSAVKNHPASAHKAVAPLIRAASRLSGRGRGVAIGAGTGVAMNLLDQLYRTISSTDPLLDAPAYYEGTSH